MANVYGLGVVSAAVAATGGGILAEIPGGTGRYTIRTIEVTWATGVAGVVGIGRPGNTPAGGTAALAQAFDPSDAAGAVSIFTAGWSTAPTVPAAFLKRASIAATLGAGAAWSFERDKLLVGRTSRAEGLVVWAISMSASTSSTFNINVEFAD